MSTKSTRELDDMWEHIGNRSDRLRVPGGWLVRTTYSSGSFEGGVGVHQIFIEDPNFTWEL